MEDFLLNQELSFSKLEFTKKYLPTVSNEDVKTVF